MHIVDVGDDFTGKGQFVFGPSAYCAEGGGFGTHSKFGPEAGQENNVRESADGLEIGFEPHLLV